MEYNEHVCCITFSSCLASCIKAIIRLQVVPVTEFILFLKEMTGFPVLWAVSNIFIICMRKIRIPQHIVLVSVILLDIPVSVLKIIALSHLCCLDKYNQLECYCKISVPLSFDDTIMQTLLENILFCNFPS